MSLKIALLISVAGGALVLGAGPPKMNIHAAPVQWLQVIDSTHPEFPKRVHSALRRDANLAETLAPVLPFSVVITNNGDQDITGVGIRFTYNTTDGRQLNRDFFYHSFSNPNDSVIPKGEGRLFTPLKTTNALAGGATSAGMVDPQGNHLPPLQSASEKHVLDALDKAPQVHVSIDLLVSRDGRSTGPDEAKTILKLSQQDNAFKGMLQEFRDRMAAGATDQDLIAWLTPISKRPYKRDPNTGMFEMTSASQTRIAQGWLSELRAGNSSRLRHSLAVANFVPTMNFKLGELK